MSFCILDVTSAHLCCVGSKLGVKMLSTCVPVWSLVRITCSSPYMIPLNNISPFPPNSFLNHVPIHIFMKTQHHKITKNNKISPPPNLICLLLINPFNLNHLTINFIQYICHCWFDLISLRHITSMYITSMYIKSVAELSNICSATNLINYFVSVILP